MDFWVISDSEFEIKMYFKSVRGTHMGGRCDFGTQWTRFHKCFSTFYILWNVSVCVVRSKQVINIKEGMVHVFHGTHFLIIRYLPKILCLLWIHIVGEVEWNEKKIHPKGVILNWSNLHFAPRQQRQQRQQSPYVSRSVFLINSYTYPNISAFK